MLNAIHIVFWLCPDQICIVTRCAATNNINAFFILYVFLYISPIKLDILHVVLRSCLIFIGNDAFSDLQT